MINPYLAFLARFQAWFSDAGMYTPGGFVWCDRLFYLIKLSQEKWACDFNDDAPPLSFQLQVTDVIF